MGCDHRQDRLGGEGITVDQAIDAARTIAQAVELPVSADFEKGYAPDAAGVARNVQRLIEQAGIVGINLEDSIGAPKAPQFDIATAAERVAAARSAAEASGIPIVINARVDTLAGGGDWDEAVTRANAYLDAGADVIFFLGLGSEDLVKRAVDAVDGRLSVFGRPGAIPLARLAELGVSRVSFGPGTLGLTLAALQRAAATLVTLGEYPEDLGFKFEL
jgi:2-methylisocitrate lyase-like PEP mutase family enzyme